MSRWLVTGGCGFIGSNFVRLLLQKPEVERVVNLDLLTYAGNLANLQDLADDPRYRFVKGDIGDEKTLGGIFGGEKYDYIINFAAETHVDRSIMAAGAFLSTNLLGVQKLFQCACERSEARFVQVGTDEVYGSLGPQGKFNEASPLNPSNPYSASKAAADLWILAIVHTFGRDALITRCSNNYGPYQFPEKLIPLCIINALSDKKIPVYGDGAQVRDWIHVNDHCRGVYAAALDGRSGEIYNFGGGGERPNLFIVEKILELSGAPPELIKHVTDRPGHDRRYAMDYGKAQRELGFNPSVGLEEGLAQTVEWYRGHPDWWRPIISGEYLDYYKKWYVDTLKGDV